MVKTMKLIKFNDNKKVEKLNNEINTQESRKDNTVLKSLAVMAGAFGVGTVAYMANLGDLSTIVSAGCLFGGVLAGILVCDDANEIEIADVEEKTCSYECELGAER